LGKERGKKKKGGLTKIAPTYLPASSKERRKKEKKKENIVSGLSANGEARFATGGEEEKRGEKGPFSIYGRIFEKKGKKKGFHRLKVYGPDFP